MADLLLDTHVLLWANEAPERLSPEAITALENPANRLLASAISAAEIEIKRRLGKLSMEHSCQTLVSRLDAEWLDLTGAHAMGLRALPLLHSDPFDRLLIAQAVSHGCPLVTADQKILAYPIETLTA
ncbi:MAG: type II toxin-antitoxin system VapC family toxin [bacterium]|nr:type II toxin-antitoxin system VapC family toxin [bacterium]MCY4194585.1 type II toxin-antitoxin system VapC family toxin [bacterium]MCY4272296.1 type II toxin-antitoxin system VapC family toxin [bacterium]